MIMTMHPHIQKNLVIFLLGTSFIACNTKPEDLPFPIKELGLSHPKTSFALSEPKKLKWANVNPDSIRPIIEKRFEFDKLPSKQVDFGEFRPLLTPMNETKLDFNALPDTVCDIRSLAKEKVFFKASVPIEPRRIKAGRARLLDAASTGVLVFGQDEGLPSGRTTCLLQDSHGIMWIGTDFGLCRFDGEYLEIFTIEQGIGDNHIRTLIEDKAGQIWIGITGGGVVVYDPRGGIFKHLSTRHGNLNTIIVSLLMDKHGLIWIGTSGGGIYIFDPTTETITLMTKRQGLSSNRIRKIIQDSKGNIWIAAGPAGIDIYDPPNRRIRHLTSQQGLSNNILMSLLEDKNGDIWIGSYRGGVNIYSPEHGILKHLTSQQGLSNDIIVSLLKDTRGNIWIGTSGGGVVVYDPVTEMIKPITILQGLSNNVVLDLLEDKNGFVWMATYGGGIDLYNLNGGELKHLGHNQGLSSNTVTALMEDQEGNTWIGNERTGIDIYFPRESKITHLASSEDLNNLTWAFLEDRKGNIWVGTDGGVDVFDRIHGTIRNIGKKQGLSSNVQLSLMEDRKGNIWMSSGAGGIDLYNPEAKTCKHLGTEEGLSSDEGDAFLEDKKGNIWIGNSGGVDIYDPSSETLRHLQGGRNLNLNQVNALLEDSLGNIWIGTSGSGVHVLDLKSSTAQFISTLDGLADMSVITLKQRNGLIYAGTGKGLTIIRPPKKDQPEWELRSYGKAQGFPYLEFNEGAALLNKKGQLWFGVGETLTIMEEPKVDTLVPPTYISGIDIAEQPQFFVSKKWLRSALRDADTVWSPLLDTSYPKTRLPADTDYLAKNHIDWDSIMGPWNIPADLRLPWNKNHLTFHFTGMHLSNSDKTRYRYVLEGADKNWSAITEKSFADYRNLSPGEYNFKVSSSGFNGSWSQPAQMSFTINPPLWQTGWARFLYVLIFAFAIWSIIRYRSRKLITENLLLEKKIEHRTDQLRLSLEDLKETQSQLVQREKMASLGELTAGIAHEIQNPLNFVNNFSLVNLELTNELKEKLDKLPISTLDKNDFSEIVKTIELNEQKISNHGTRADSIIKNMLLHSRSSSGHRELTNINSLADEYLRLSYHGLRAKDKFFNATLLTDLDEGVEQVNIVSQDIGRVLLNLYNNAFYSLKEKSKQKIKGYEPTLSVSTKKINGKLEITVKDNGIGIPGKVVDKIFQPFFTTKPTGQGTGLGLSLSYDIITKEHNGQIKVETKENEYAEFTIVLPLNQS